MNPSTRIPTQSRSADGGRDAFRRRAAAALTHPLTLASLAALLVNDIALKRVWPDSWATGKISDLAWMVFAPPLLAFALSHLVGRSALAGRAGFAIAYLCLPLLYAAFNTFEPVHSAILRGLALVGGAGPGAPLDPTDSAVIPLAMAVALWVWRRPPPPRQPVRARLALLTMAVAALATVATSYPPPVLGVTNVEAGEDGTIRAYADGDYGPSLYESRDGGLTWMTTNWFNSGEPSIRVRTPSGDYYAIEGTDIVRTGGGEREVLYSAAYLENYSDVWVHTRDTQKYGIRRLTHAPNAIAYDDASGNVIAAMGMHGVVVGSPDRTWRRVAVGPFEPTDLSFTNKLRGLWDPWFLWLAFAFTASFATLGLAPSLTANRRESDDRARAICLMGVPAAICSIYILIGGLYPTGPTPSGESGLLWPGLLPSNYLNFPIGLLVLLIAVAGVSVNPPTGRQALVGIATIAGMLLLVLLAFLLWLQVNLQLGFANLFALLFVGLAAVALYSYTALSARGSAREGAARDGEG